MERRKGWIKTVNTEKGFGFIRDEAGAEFFFHRSGVKGTAFEHLNKGMSVTFEPKNSDRGWRAEDVMAS